MSEDKPDAMKVVEDKVRDGILSKIPGNEAFQDFVLGPVDLDEVVAVDEKDIAAKEFDRLLEEAQAMEAGPVAARHNQGKPQMGYIFHYPHALEALAGS